MVTRQIITSINDLVEPDERQLLYGAGLSASYNISDLPKIEHIFKEIRTNRRSSNQLLPFCQSIEDKFNDRRSSWNQKYDAPEPNNASFDVNALTTDGIQLTNENITGEDGTRMLWMISGKGNLKKPNMFTPSLEDENARMSIETQGWFFARGTTLVQGCKFIDSLPSATVVEFGSSNTDDPEDPEHVLWWRTRIVSPSQYIQHSQYETIYLHVHVIDIRSVSE